MRWDPQTTTVADSSALPGLEARGAVLEAWPTPGFDGASFLEVTAKSALNRVPGAGYLGGTWTINPYRGCQHACVYCFARSTHEYLDLNAGADFDQKIIVKANIVDVLERELRGRRHTVDAVQFGTNTDPYQRAEGRYRLMPGLVSALADHGAGISVLTKGTLLRRDIPLLASISHDVPVQVAMSIAVFDDELQQSIEPGTPSTAARLATVRAAADAGLDVGVFLMPVLPGLTDSEAHIDRACREIAAAGAHHVAGTTLHLRPGAREWFAAWLGRERPDLTPLYRSLYGNDSYASQAYRARIRERLSAARQRYGLTTTSVTPGTGLPATRTQVPASEQAKRVPSSVALF